MVFDLGISEVFSIVADITIVGYKLVGDNFVVLRVEVKELKRLSLSCFDG